MLFMEELELFLDLKGIPDEIYGDFFFANELEHLPAKLLKYSFKKIPKRITSAV